MADLENWRHDRALKGWSSIPETVRPNLETFLYQELTTQIALSEMSVNINTPTSDLPGLNSWYNRPDLLHSGQRLIITVDGMQGTYKTTNIERWKQNLPKRLKKWISFAPDGLDYFNNNPRAEDLKKLKYSRPDIYHTALTVSGILALIGAIPHGEGIVVKERGELEMMVFRRALFLLGETWNFSSRSKDDNHYLMLNIVGQGTDRVQRPEDPFSFTIFPLGIMIMCLVRPHISAERKKKKYSQDRKAMWETIYEQYLRLHWEIITGKQLVPYYICLNMECNPEESYSKLSTALNQAVVFAKEIHGKLRST